MTIDDEETVISVLAQLGITPAKINYPSGREVIVGLDSRIKRSYVRNRKLYKNNLVAYLSAPETSA